MLTIVIPALNEEQSIVSTCRRCCAEAPRIRAATGETVELIVVDDGSTDRTAELARGVEGVRVVSHGRNRGYGAALLTGFRAGTGDLVGFLDADGTCDPRFFVPMIQAVQGGASIALGNRMGPGSGMPRVRRLGNRFFAALIRLLSGTHVADSASGMRVLTRDALGVLEPLPDGLHFTPAMSCRAALDPRLRIVEVPMTYAEREGRSKLSVVRDGWRFLRVIVETALSYRPLLILGSIGALQLAVAVLYALGPLRDYLGTGHLAPDRVYRMLTVLVLFGGGLAFLYAGVLGDLAQELVNPPRPRGEGLRRRLRAALFGHPVAVAALAVAIAVGMNARALWEYATTGHIAVDWATIAFGGVLSLAAVQLLAFAFVQRMLIVLGQRIVPARVERRVAFPHAPTGT
ncbi:MAG: glycosyltransferase family 2 protein [Candidatus Binatia bacterium]